MRFTKKEKGWIAYWVSCYECPCCEDCTEQTPCNDCKMVEKLSKKLKKW